MTFLMSNAGLAFAIFESCVFAIVMLYRNDVQRLAIFDYSEVKIHDMY
jgi:hypothetical protein